MSPFIHGVVIYEVQSRQREEDDADIPGGLGLYGGSMAFHIIRNDIVSVCADAIVNTAHPFPTCGSGTDRAIYLAAGEDLLLSARKKIGNIEVGEVAHTPAFALNAKYIIHAVGPAWEGGDSGEVQLLRNAYQNVLKLAKTLGCRSVAFPLISTGALGFPKQESLKIAVEVFSRFLLEYEMEITLVVFDDESFDISGKIFGDLVEYIDRHYVEEKFREAPNSSGRTFERMYRADQSKARRGGEEAEESDFQSTVAEECLEFRADEFALESESKLASELALEPSFGYLKKRSLADVVQQLTETWQESLLRMIDEKGLTDVEVYKRANADRKLFSKIRGNSAYQPKKHTAVAFALALRLNLDETKNFLEKAGFALSTSSKFDLIISYFIENEVYDIYLINLALFEHEQTLLGN